MMSARSSVLRDSDDFTELVPRFPHGDASGKEEVPPVQHFLLSLVEDSSELLGHGLFSDENEPSSSGVVGSVTPPFEVPPIDGPRGLRDEIEKWVVELEASFKGVEMSMHAFHDFLGSLRTFPS
jgi:hypothetical protein